MSFVFRDHLTASHRRRSMSARRSPEPLRITSPVDGIVLAAGRSRRMGELKPLLRTEEGTFLARAVSVQRLGGCRRIVCVVPWDAPEVAAEAARVEATAILNGEDGGEQIDSLRIGIAALPPDSAAAVVLPVDHPAVSAPTVAALIRAFRARHRPIVRPVYGSSPGHPTLFSCEVFAELSAPLAEGARTVIARYAGRIDDVVVDDPGVLVNIDTPADLRRLGQQ